MKIFEPPINIGETYKIKFRLLPSANQPYQSIVQRKVRNDFMERFDTERYCYIQIVEDIQNPSNNEKVFVYKIPLKLWRTITQNDDGVIRLKSELFIMEKAFIIEDVATRVYAPEPFQMEQYDKHEIIINGETIGLIKNGIDYSVSDDKITEFSRWLKEVQTINLEESYGEHSVAN